AAADGAVLGLDEDGFEFALGHTGDVLGLQAGVAAFFADVACEGAVDTAGAGGFTLVEEHGLHGVDELVGVFDVAEVGGVRLLAPDVTCVADHRAVGAVSEDEARLVTDALEDVVASGVEAVFKVERDDGDAELVGDLLSGAPAGEDLDDVSWSQLLVQLAVEVARGGAAVVGVAPGAAVGEAEDAQSCPPCVEGLRGPGRASYSVPRERTRRWSRLMTSLW